jgi:hypothetical protein
MKHPENIVKTWASPAAQREDRIAPGAQRRRCVGTTPDLAQRDITAPEGDSRKKSYR